MRIPPRADASRVEKVNEAFERTTCSDVRYRFVIDADSLRN